MTHLNPHIPDDTWLDCMIELAAKTDITVDLLYALTRNAKLADFKATLALQDQYLRNKALNH